MFCPKCGAKQASKGNFCEKCGQAIDSTSTITKSKPLGIPVATLIGGASAIIAGFLLSFASFRLWTAAFLHELQKSAGMDLPLFQVKSFIEHIAPKLSFLNLYAYQHITISGNATFSEGGGNMSGNGGFVFPLLSSTLIPITAIMFGAVIANILAKTKDFQTSSRVGYITGLVFAVLMVVLRPFAVIRSEQFNLPIPILGYVPIPSVSIGPTFLSTVFYALIFGVIFGWLGGRIYALKKGFKEDINSTPKWITAFKESSMALGARAVAEGIIASMLILTVIGVIGVMSDEVRNDFKREGVSAGNLILMYLPIMPTLGSAGYYFSHGISLGCEAIAEGGAGNEFASFSVNTFSGLQERGRNHSKTEPLPGWIYAVFVIPCITVGLAGYRLASRKLTRDPIKAAIEGAKIASSYALFLTIFSLLLKGAFSFSGGGSSGDFGMDLMRIRGWIGVPFFSTIFWGLLWGAVMGAIGGFAAYFVAAPVKTRYRMCSKCLSKIPSDSKFCQVCGESIS